MREEARAAAGRFDNESEACAAQEQLWRPYADAGDADALYEIGILYWCDDDPDIAAGGLALLNKAVEPGSGDALYELHGDEDWEVTKKAALMGGGMAAHHLGASYAMGHGVPQDFVEGIRWYKIGADAGDAGCQYDLGFMYLLGQGTAANVAEGIAWLEKAGADSGWGASLAARLLADLYEGGYYGVPRNPETAAYWRRRRNEFE